MSLFAYAQTAVNNFGNFKMHEDASVGFHTDIINNGSLDNDNQGFAGIYSTNELRSISGNNRAVFYNVEIDAINDLELYTSLGVTNELNFENGTVYTPRDGVNVSLNFLNDNVYFGANNTNHVDGYASVSQSYQYTFPVGDNNYLRPLEILCDDNTITYHASYNFYDPNTPPSNFSQAFTTTDKQIFINKISSVEFWTLIGTGEVQATLTWNPNSKIDELTSDLETLRVVGWSISDNKWVDLGGVAYDGDMFNGKVTSDLFIPNAYEVITLASGFGDGDLSNVNIIFTPNNGDDKNDTLVFEGLEKYQNNNLVIYNRWGSVVYTATDYTNNWRGNSEGKMTINEDDDLPVGTYFYTLELRNDNVELSRKGWIYIHR
ncbi:hypothetical protein BSU00_12175 [Tenacibaculum sp. SG-28]|nr:hypothetical protein BSU00_12175 [Tenacibaculum sp. SG-28]